MTMSGGTRRFATYNALEKILRRAQVSSSGAVATLLLECFMEDGGRLQASKVVSRNICEEGCFHVWRDEMVKGRWLAWSINQADKGQYHPGKRLVPYINKEKISSKEIATRDEIVTRDEVPSKEEFEALKDEVAKIKVSMKEIYETLDLGEPDPPDFKKLKLRTTAVVPN